MQIWVELSSYEDHLFHLGVAEKFDEDYTGDEYFFLDELPIPAEKMDVLKMVHPNFSNIIDILAAVNAEHVNLPPTSAGFPDGWWLRIISTNGHWSEWR